MDPSSPSCRLRKKTSPKVTAVKSKAQPASDGHKASGSSEKPWDASARLRMLKMLFAWPVYVWQIFFAFRQRVKNTYARDGEYRKAAEEVVSGNKRRRLNGTDARDTLCDDKALAHEMLQRLSEVSMSSSFSGIDTPATSFLSLGAGLCECLDLSWDHIPRPRNAFGVEWLHASQLELLQHPHGPEHVFCDIAEFWQPRLASRIDDIVAAGQLDEDVLPLIRQNKAMKRTAFCLRHNKECEAGRFPSCLLKFGEN